MNDDDGRALLCFHQRLARTPRKLPQPLPLEPPQVLTTRAPLTIRYLPGYATVEIPAGTDVELVGYSERSGLPRIACAAYGIRGAIVDPEKVGLPAAAVVRPPS